MYAIFIADCEAPDQLTTHKFGFLLLLPFSPFFFYYLFGRDVLRAEIWFSGTNWASSFAAPWCIRFLGRTALKIVPLLLSSHFFFCLLWISAEKVIAGGNRNFVWPISCFHFFSNASSENAWGGFSVTRDLSFSETRKLIIHSGARCLWENAGGFRDREEIRKRRMSTVSFLDIIIFVTTGRLVGVKTKKLKKLTTKTSSQILFSLFPFCYTEHTQ